MVSSTSLFISAGEISGDLHAAELMSSLSDRGDFTFYGMGGTHMRALGLKGLDEDVSTLNTVGFAESLLFISRHLKNLKKALGIIKKHEIKFVILVDNQGFNMILGKKVREMGCQVFYYIPPRVSVWGKWNAPKIAEIAHHILPFLESDVELYQGLGSKVFYPGNPVADKIESFTPDKEFLNRHKIPQDKTVISVFPGSRRQEIRKLLPVFMETARRLVQDHDMYILISLAHESYRKAVEKIIRKKRIGDSVALIAEAPYDVMINSEICIMASGTATLESALLGRWPLICYRISRLSYAIASKLVTKKMIGLPNILLDEKYFPELLQKELNPNSLIQGVMDQLQADSDKKKKDEQKYLALREACGRGGVADRAADYIQEQLYGTRTGD